MANSWFKITRAKDGKETQFFGSDRFEVCSHGPLPPPLCSCATHPADTLLHLLPLSVCAIQQMAAYLDKPYAGPFADGRISKI